MMMLIRNLVQNMRRTGFLKVEGARFVLMYALRWTVEVWLVTVLDQDGPL